MITAFGTRVTSADVYAKRSEHVGACSSEKKRPCGEARPADINSDHRRYLGFAMQTLDEAERREYYRIADRIALEIRPLKEAAAPQDQSLQDASPIYSLLSELHLSEFESQHLLRQLSDKDRVLASFLRAQNKRIDLLTQIVAQSLMGEIGEPQAVVISEAGLEFRAPAPYSPGTTLDLKMAFMPQALGMLLRAQVIHCDPAGEGQYDIGVEFIGLSDAQRQLLARYILQKQAQERRQAREQNEPGTY